MKYNFLLCFLIIVYSGSAQLLINEVSSKNPGVLSDEDGDFSDWVEIFNASAASVNLENYYLTDNANARKWLFPNIELAAGNVLGVFASGKNKNNVGNNGLTVDHWETAVFDDDDDWKYFIGTAEPPQDWNSSSFDTSQWMTGRGGFGYGDNDDNTLVPPGTLSIFIRKSFHVSQKSDIVKLILSMDYDDAFIAYLNGIEITKQGISSNAAYNKLADIEHEAVMYSGTNPYQYFLTDDQVKNIMVSGENILAIQIHNIDPTSSDLTASPFLHMGIHSGTQYFRNNPSWFNIPGDKTSMLHTNFKLEAEEVVKIFHVDGTLLDSFRIPYLELGHFSQRIPDGQSWCIAETQSFNKSNAGFCFEGYSDPPVFSLTSGFYSGTQGISLSGNQIKFTVDGSIPTDKDSVYRNPLPIQKSTVIRARNYQNGKLPSLPVTRNYFINEKTELPVLSIHVKPEDFFFNQTGGPAVYDNYAPENKCQVHLAYYNKNKNLEFEEFASAKVVGNYSTAFPQKSLQFSYDEEYGARNEVMYNIFSKDKPKIRSSHGFRIRNMDDDWSSTRIRDIVVNQMALQTECATAGYQHVAVFINGEYWGHYGAREILDKYFVRDNYDAEEDSVDMIKTSYGLSPTYYTEEGSEQSFLAMSDSIIFNDLRNQIAFDKHTHSIDLLNWIDYYAEEMYIANGDWFSSIYFNNTRLFSSRKPNITWKFLLWDCTYSSGNGVSVYENILEQALLYPAVPNRYTQMMNSLLKNQNFKHLFINRFADLLNDHWTKSKIHSIIDLNANELRSEINRQSQRWGSLSVNDWNNSINGLKQFYTERTPIQRNQIENFFHLNDQHNIQLDVEPSNAGTIKISTIVPRSYPWTGVYFENVPIPFTAIANPGYTFSHWSAVNGIGDTNHFHFVLPDLATGIHLIAHFIPDSNTEFTITISEVNYHSDSTLNCGDWIELYNFGTREIPFVNWTFRGSKENQVFKFPDHFSLMPKSYVVLCHDPEKWRTFYPTVTQVLGPVDFEFSNNGERLSLLNSIQDTVVSLLYSDKIPWPQCADGHGRTMENININSKIIHNPMQWIDGCILGSPSKPYTECREEIVINEINYKSADHMDVGDWLEIKNESNIEVDLSSWKLTDNNGLDVSYQFPANTLLAYSGYLVVFSDSIKFHSVFTNIQNKTGPFATFGLGGNGDLIKLYDHSNKLIFSVFYNDASPWPKNPDGLGTTLQRKEFSLNSNLATNWFSGCFLGTPGRYNSQESMPIIQGNSTAKINQAEVYTVDESIPNTMYNWAISSNGTILSGQGTHSITVTWNQLDSGTLSLQLFNVECFGQTIQNVTILHPSITDGTKVPSPYLIYPNPSSGIIHIMPKDQLPYSLSILNGQSVEKSKYKNLTGIHRIELENYSSGIYCIKITNPKSSYFQIIEIIR